MKKRVDLVTKVGVIFLGLGILIGCLYLYPKEWYLSSLVSDFYANFSAEFISISITILLIDYLYEQKENSNKKSRLLRELASEDKGFTSRALRELKEMGCITDGSLNGLDLSKANLSGLDFSNAVFNNVILEEAFLDNAVFKNAKLTNVTLNGASMREANFDNCTLLMRE